MTETKFVRVGHKGAAALAPENTIASLAAALEHGVDMIEFDVVDAPDGRLVLAHSHEEIAPEAPTLDEALAFVAAEAEAHVAIDLDLKWYGFEARIVDGLREHGLLGRSLASSFFSRTLRELKRLEPGLRTGLSYPWDRRGLSTRRVLQPAVGVGAAALRRALPYRICRMVGRADAGSAMLHYAVVSRAAVECCHRRGISVFVWTVDDPELLDTLVWMGVDGVITNDPRIFGLDEGRR
jgi:glycerophosphoryl diester phosphodiesterase